MLLIIFPLKLILIALQEGEADNNIVSPGKDKYNPAEDLEQTICGWRILSKGSDRNRMR